ncbi:MAG TPA: porin [Rhizomicrobium sp.]
MKLRLVLLCGATTLAAVSPASAADANAFLASLAAMPHMAAPHVADPAAAPAAETPAVSTPAHPPAKHTVRVARAEKPVVAAAAPSTSALEQKVAAQQAQIALLMAKVDSIQTAPKPEPTPPKPEAPPAKPDSPSWTMANGRPVIASADGHFTLAIRALGQFDAAYYSQGAHATQLAAANGPDLSSGQNFRRVQLGVQGKAFGDWSYQFNYDFGGSSGTESPGRIQAAYVEYDGLAPFAVRIGAFPASAGLEDNTSASDTMFLERNAPAELARNIAGGDGRDAIAVTYAGDRIYGAVSYTGNKIADAGAFDEQQALLGRLSGLVYSSDAAKIVVSANGTYVFKVADTAAGANAPRSFSLSAAPELTVDNTGAKLVNTGTLNAEQVFQWGLETGAQWNSFYGQAGYFGFAVAERGVAAAPSVNFGGWYAQASWVLTGESRGYNAASGAFGNPKPTTPFAADGMNWGTFEVAARYSDLNLNDNAGIAGSATPAGGVRGGDQRIATLALNWYPNSEIRFELQAQNTAVNRLGTIPAGFGHGVLSNVQVGQSFSALALRSQIAF